jgi:hypothetical protein
MRIFTDARSIGTLAAVFARSARYLIAAKTDPTISVVLGKMILDALGHDLVVDTHFKDAPLP